MKNRENRERRTGQMPTHFPHLRGLFGGSLPSGFWKRTSRKISADLPPPLPQWSRRHSWDSTSRGSPGNPPGRRSCWGPSNATSPGACWRVTPARFTSCPVADRRALQRVINTAQKVIALLTGHFGGPTQLWCLSGAAVRLKEPYHPPGHHLFDQLPSGRCFRSMTDKQPLTQSRYRNRALPVTEGLGRCDGVHYSYTDRTSINLAWYGRLHYNCTVQ